MSIVLLVRQIQLEFANDPRYNIEAIRYDVGEIWQKWRSGVGRHVQDELSAKFCEWWIKNYEECLIQDGVRVSYEEFLRLLHQCATPAKERLSS